MSICVNPVEASESALNEKLMNVEDILTRFEQNPSEPPIQTAINEWYSLNEAWGEALKRNEITSEESELYESFLDESYATLAKYVGKLGFGA